MPIRPLIALCAAALLAPVVAAAEPAPWLRSTLCHLHPDAPVAAAGAPSLAGAAKREKEGFSGGAAIWGDERAYHVAFTFDDGPQHETTAKVLDALDRYDVPATFFVVGWRFAGEGVHSRRNRAVLHDVIARGYHVANHTMTHENMARADSELLAAEIDGATEAIREELGFRPYLFRPPYGAMDDQARAFIGKRGYTSVRWSIDSQDFRSDLSRSVRERVVSDIIEDRGGVVLMHDTKWSTANNIAGILDDLEAHNCRQLAQGERIIVPVSLHYFMNDENDELREIPPEVAERTERYRKALPGRCEARGE